LDELVAAVFQLFVGRFLHIEKSLKIVKLLSLVFNLLNFGEVLTDFSISILDDSGRCLLGVVWQVGLEFLSEFSNLDLEFSKSILNVGGFFVLEWKNLFFNWS
jgi:hypothetical protein